MMPQQKGCIPWNKGIKTNVPSFRRLKVTDDDVNNMINLYTVGKLTLKERIDYLNSGHKFTEIILDDWQDVSRIWLIR